MFEGFTYIAPSVLVEQFNPRSPRRFSQGQSSMTNGQRPHSPRRTFSRQNVVHSGFPTSGPSHQPEQMFPADASHQHIPHQQQAGGSHQIGVPHQIGRPLQLGEIGTQQPGVSTVNSNNTSSMAQSAAIAVSSNNARNNYGRQFQEEMMEVQSLSLV